MRINEEEFTKVHAPILQEVKLIDENSDDNGYMPRQRRENVGTNQENIREGVLENLPYYYQNENKRISDAKEWHENSPIYALNKDDMLDILIDIEYGKPKRYKRYNIDDVLVLYDDKTDKTAKHERVVTKGVSAGSDDAERYAPRAHVEQPDATRVEPKPQGKPDPNTVYDFEDGVAVAGENVVLSWKYALENIKKAMTKDEQKKQEIQKKIDDIVEEHGKLPKTEGWAQLGRTATNVAGVGVPTLVAGTVGGGGAATMVGAGLASLDMATTAAQANIEIDEYEKQSGMEVSPSARAGYTAATVATDAIMNSLAQSKVLGNFTAPVQKEIAKTLKKSILENPIAQQEFNTMARQVMQNEAKSSIKDMAKMGLKSSIEGGVSAGALEAEKGIYMGEMPEMQRIVDEAVGGAVSGAAQGVAMGISSPRLKHKDRMAKDDVYYVSDMHGQTGSGLPISEIDPSKVHYTPDGMVVEGKVRRSDGKGEETGLYKGENIVGGSYREAEKSGELTPIGDAWDIDEKKMAEYEKEWAEARKGKNGIDYEKRNEVVQGIAADMGLPVTVYKSIDEVPSRLRKEGQIGSSEAVTINNGSIVVVLDNCKYLNARDMRTIMLHEGVGHVGVPRSHKSPEEFEQNAERAGKYLIGNGTMNDYEESIAYEAEDREYHKRNSGNKEYDYVNSLLRQGEHSVRNSTTNELRNPPNRRFIDRVLQDGEPMPMLREIERQRQQRRQGQ